MTPQSTPTVLSRTPLIERFGHLRRPAANQTESRRLPHPGDIVYWVTCVGAACLLLLAAT